eukprot:5315621-Amphidinium_carterae.1
MSALQIVLCESLISFFADGVGIEVMQDGYRWEPWATHAVVRGMAQKGQRAPSRAEPCTVQLIFSNV